MEEHVYPAEDVFERQLEELPSRWHVPPVMEELKAKAKAQGLWNLFRPKREYADALSNEEYAPLCEIMGRVADRPGVVQLLGAGHRQHGDDRALRHRRRRRSDWLEPLLDGKIRSCFAMTEPAVASSDATNIQSEHRARRRRLRHQRPQVVDLRRRRSALQDLHLHGQDRPRRADATSSSRWSSCRWRRRASRSCATLTVFGYDDAPHGHAEVSFENVRVPVGEHPARRGPRLRDRAGAPRARAASTTACAASASPSARSR